MAMYNLYPFRIRIFLIKGILHLAVGEALELSEQYTGSGTPDIVTLRHPNTGEAAVFLFSPANNSVQEVLTFNEGKRSWFIDETVKSDGKMHLSTPIDPIFLGHSIRSTLRDEEFPETERLLNLVGDEELNAFKYNEERTLMWLKKKIERVAEILKQRRTFMLVVVQQFLLHLSSHLELKQFDNDAYISRKNLKELNERVVLLLCSLRLMPKDKNPQVI
ncbi:unnamed protein product [Acanthoscelides obtectus]|uniref:Rnh202 triple barrel domain-containing protein n=1 Tax=Acanthoscelides obtectus TaxID=200917 RepID=A0A9P0Q450_ACAOB|nr:unnamed protein product [Acanthoscelides obtectus]CAK1678350.1 Ribonuclease H2 subunit B [Acanthoscelides obtectus]